MVLPQPLPPTRATNFPAGMWRDTSLMAHLRRGFKEHLGPSRVAHSAPGSRKIAGLCIHYRHIYIYMIYYIMIKTNSE